MFMYTKGRRKLGLSLLASTTEKKNTEKRSETSTKVRERRKVCLYLRTKTDMSIVALTTTEKDTGERERWEKMTYEDGEKIRRMLKKKSKK